MVRKLTENCLEGELSHQIRRYYRPCQAVLLAPAIAFEFSWLFTGTNACARERSRKKEDEGIGPLAMSVAVR